MTLRDGWPPFYAERRSSASVDVDQLYLAYVIGALIFTVFLILPGVRGVERLYFMMRWLVSLVIGAVIVACSLGMEWQVGQVDADFRHRINDENLTELTLGLKVGLTQFNVTLSGSHVGQGLHLNERFYFIGIDETLEHSLESGVAFPIHTVAEHFSSNRFHSLWPWGRIYWMAGHYASYLLWTALACWILTNVLFNMVLLHGSLFLILTGVLLLSADISFATVNAKGKLHMQVGYHDPRKILEVSYGWCFWASLITGAFCIVLGVSAIALDMSKKQYLEKFFMIENDEETFSINKKENGLPSIPRRPSKGILKTPSPDGLENPTFVVETREDGLNCDVNQNSSVSIRIEEPDEYKKAQVEVVPETADDSGSSADGTNLKDSESYSDSKL